jgi:hypothetical protein
MSGQDAAGRPRTPLPHQDIEIAGEIMERRRRARRLEHHGLDALASERDADALELLALNVVARVVARHKFGERCGFDGGPEARRDWNEGNLLFLEKRGGAR